MTLYNAASEWFYCLSDLEDEFNDNKISKGEKIKDIIEDLNGDEDLTIIVDNNKQESSELDDETYYKFLGFSNLLQNYMSGPEGEVGYYLFKFETVE